MESQNYLGIYISKDAATIVCLGSQNRDILGCFSVSAEQQEPTAPGVGLASLIAQSCAERGLQFTEAAVAMDCAMFMQHNVHSGFEDPKQIAATVRFDTEEALACDITDVAVAFRIISSEQGGSKLAVFTAQRKILSDIILSLQSNNIDPVTVEPDVNCLSRFIGRNISLSEDLRPLYCILSRRSGYFVAFSGPQEPSAMRTSLLGPAQNGGELLARQVPVTAALVEAAEPINCLKVFDSSGPVNCQQLGEKVGIEAASIDLAKSVEADPQVLSDCADVVDFAIAYGAALALSEKPKSVNFRTDFMPYQGGKARLQKALKLLSISATVLVLVLGLYFQLRWSQKNKSQSLLHSKFTKDYSAVMFGERPPAKIKDGVKELGSALRHIENVKKGLITDEQSVSAKLTLVLEAFNKCAKQADLNVDSIAITTKSISIAGDTYNRKSTIMLHKALEESKLGNLQDSINPKGNRDNFHITIVPPK